MEKKLEILINNLDCEEFWKTMHDNLLATKPNRVYLESGRVIRGFPDERHCDKITKEEYLQLCLNKIIADE